MQNSGIKKPALFILFILAAGTSNLRPFAGENDNPSAMIAVTTTLIETAVRELAGDDVPLIRLMQPGACPGYFDIDPGQANRIAGASLIIRHDYQAALDTGIMRFGLPRERILAVTSRPAFTVPAHYAAMCAELTPHLARIWPKRAEAIKKQLLEINQKAASAQTNISERSGGLRGRKVISAGYQRQFCEWIGLHVVAVFWSGMDESAQQLSRTVHQARTAGAEAVIGNKQWGTRHLHALSEATGLPGIMLDNFPENGRAGAFWILLEANTRALLNGLP